MPRSRASLSRAVASIAIEGLEARRLLSTFIPASGFNDLVFDATRDVLYMPTSSNGVLRYDVANGAPLPKLNVPGTLLAGDITDDGASLYLTDNSTTMIRKLDLASGTYTSLNYSQSFYYGYDAVDIAIGSNGKALFTTTYPGSGFVPMWEIDLATDTTSTRPDYPGGLMRQDSHLGRSADRATFFIAEGNSSIGPMSVYDAATDTWPLAANSGWYLSGARPAVSRDGTLGSFGSSSGAGGVSVRDLTMAGLPEVQLIRKGQAGSIFSPIADVLWVGMAATSGAPQYIVGYDTNTWNVASVIEAGGSLGHRNSPTEISPDGRWLFFGTSNGVRMYDTTAEAMPSPFQLAGDGTLTINGFAGNDAIAFYTDQTTLHADVNGIAQSMPLSSVTRIIINGLGGNDSLRIDEPPRVPMEWDGGAGTNTLLFYGSNGSDLLTLDESRLTGTLPPLVAGDPQRSIDLTIANTDAVTVNGASGADTLSAFNAPAGATWLIHGGLWGGDTLIRGAAAGRIDMQGSSSDNDFIAYGTEGEDEVFIYSWSSDGRRGYRFNGVDSNVYGASSIRFELLGGDDRGIIGVDYTYPPTTINGGAGNDVLGQRSTATGTAVSRPMTYLGGDGDDLFYVRDRKIFTVDGGDGIDGMIADAEDVVTNVENVGTASISGYAFNDMDRDGVRDPDETALANAAIYLDENGDGARQTSEYRVFTTSTGNYSLSPLMAGTYIVRAIPPDSRPDLAQTASGEAGHSVTVGWSDSVSNQNFGFAPQVHPATEGMPDADFGQWGNVVVDYSNTSDYPTGIGVQSDGKIIAGGHNSPISSSGGIHGALRFHPDGTVDTTFGSAGSGWAKWGLPGSSTSWPNSMLVLPDDRILLAGGTGSTPGLSRLTANGLLDTTFNGTGTVVASSINGNFGHLALIGDGRFYVSGWAWNMNGSSVQAPFVARYHASGTLDTSFGGDGIVVLPISSSTMTTTTNAQEDIRVQADAEGRAVVTLPTRQKAFQSTPHQASLFRLNLDGTADETFGAGGRLNLISPGGNSAPEDFKILPDNRMIVAGRTMDSSGLNAGVFVARLLPDGSLDEGLGVGGFHVREIGTDAWYGHWIAPTADGRLVMLTRAAAGGVRLERLTADGQPDPTFAADSDTPGTMSVWIPPRTSGGSGGGSPRGLIVQPDGKPLALAMVYDKGWDFALVRLLGADPNAGRPTAKLTTTTATPLESAAATVVFSDARAAGGGSSVFRYSFDFDNDGTYEIIDSEAASAAIPVALLDDGPRRLTVRGRIRDVGGGTVTENHYLAYLVITNVAPTASVRTYTSSINEGSSGARIRLSGLADPSQADLAAGLRFSYDFDGDGLWEVSDSASDEVLIPESYYADGPRTLNMVARVADKDGGASDYVLTMQVQNDPPLSFAGSDRSATAGTALMLSGSAVDPSPSDVVTGSWVIRDPNEQIIAHGDGFTFEFLPPTAGVYTAELIATDDDGAEGRDSLEITAAAPAFLSAAPGAAYRFSSGSDGLTLTVESGEVTLTDDAGAVHPGLNVEVLGGRLTLDADQRFASLTVATGATVDIADSSLAIDYSGASPIGGWDGSAYTGIAGMIRSGRTANATWDGEGIITSMPDARSGITGVGVGEAANLLGLTAGQTALWNGHTVDATTVILKYTYAGDANLDGQNDAGDYGIIDNFVQVPVASGYGNGDFNYDGFIDAGDYGIIDNNIQAQGAPLSSVSAATGVQPTSEALTSVSHTHTGIFDDGIDDEEDEALVESAMEASSR